LLTKIFLLKGKNSQNLNHLDIYSYPEDLTKKEDINLFQKIISGHEKGEIQYKHNLNNINNQKLNVIERICNDFTISPPVPQIIDQHNMYTLCINSTILIGLVFEKDDNPYDYKEIFEELLNELLNAEKCCHFDDEMEIENFLITLFVDIRRYGDEILDTYPKISILPVGISAKIFLFGIDNAGKSSFVRRIKTGQFNDNYFSPTRKFNIEYIQKPNGMYSFWDMGGQFIFREKWLDGIQDSNIIIFMIDVANQIRFEEAKKEFWNIIKKYDFSDALLLILGNKVDLIKDINNPDNQQIERIKNEILDFFELDKLANIEWKFMLTSVKTNYNVDKVVSIVLNFA
jgi:ADP-ribosylation factor-like protein 8